MKLKKNYTLLKIFIALALVLLAAGCGTDGSVGSGNADTGAITAKLNWSNDTSANIDSAPSGVVTVRIIVSGTGMSDVQKDFASAVGHGTVDNIPAGSNRTLTAKGLDANSNVIAQGTISNITIVTGQTTDVGTINLITNRAPTNGLIAYYPFTGNAMDASGNGHHGSVVRATLTSDRNNNADRAYYFNGIDSYIVVSPGDAFAPNQFTICAMVFIEEQVTTNCCPRIVHRMRWAPCQAPGDPCNGTGYALHYQKFGENNYNSLLSFNFFDIDKKGINPLDKSSNVVSPPNLEYGKWYQVAATYDEKAIKFYFNGILNHTKAVPSPIAHTPGMSFFIGTDGGVGTFKGKIDEVYFYNRVLTDDEILQFKS
jgi:hypothetical protein